VAAAGILVSLSASGAGVSLDGGGEVVRRETIATGWQRMNARSSTGKESSRRRGSWHRGRSASVAAAAALRVAAAGVASVASGRRSAPCLARWRKRKKGDAWSPVFLVVDIVVTGIVTGVVADVPGPPGWVQHC